MYKIFLNDDVMYSANVENLKIFEPKIELEQNALGSFSFKIEKSNPNYYRIEKMKSLITVYQENDIIFRGRVTEDGDNTQKIKNVYCEGELSFLIDSIQESYNYQGSVRGFFELLINNHNAQVEEYKQFKVGEVTVTDANDYITRSDTLYLTTWESIKKKLIELLGGYIVVRHEADGNYIDYLADYNTLNSQEVTFGENLLSVKRTENGANIATVIIPLGAKLEDSEERLTIESVNDGKKYIESEEGIKNYGRITKVVTFDDVTLPENLKSKGEKALGEAVMLTASIEINAVDMASIKKNIHNFKLNSKIKVVSEYHGINDYFVPLKMSISLFKQEQNKITLNETKKTLTGSTSDSNANLGGIIEIVENITNNYNVNVPQMLLALQQELSTLIEQTAKEITMQVGESYYNKGDTNELISNLETILNQTSTYFEMQFNSFSQDLNDILEGTNANFEDIRKYIRFEDGNIILGQVGNEFTLKITKDRISFFQSAQEIAYISNSKLYNTMVEVMHSLQIGRFAFIPRKNGNLTFTKVVS